MKKSKKVFLIISVFLIVTGTVVCGIAFGVMGFDFSNLRTVELESYSYYIEQDFENIKIDCVEGDVFFAKSNDGVCRIDVTQSDNVKHNAWIENQILMISRADEREWYEHIAIGTGGMSVTVYLPEDSYNSVDIKSISGDIIASETFSFNSMRAETTSGDIRISSSVKDMISAESTSGDIILRTPSCTSLEAKTRSGDIELINTIASERIELDSVSGDIEFENCDAGELYIDTVSGDVEGVLLSGKDFDVDTTSGDIEIPRGSSGGRCRIETTSGDIEINVRGS